MIASILFRILLFLLPFVIYWLYTVLQKQAEAAPIRRRKPWTMLFVSGLLLIIISLVAEGLIGGESIDGQYVPPHMEDGRVVPGHVAPMQELGQ